MKGKKFALLMILPMLVGFARAGSYVIEDDIYYNPDAKNPIVEQKEKEKAAEQQAKQAQQAQPAAPQEAQPAIQQEPVQKTLVMTTDNHFFDVDEYNRRGSSSQEMTLEQVAANQTEPNVEYNIVDENGDDGYYLNGFNGSQSDYEYALRIRRFHNPKFTISISDPFYSDIYFLDNNDWNVYISDNYAWVTPTWTNPWYWDYMWSPYSYTSWSWRWNLGPWGFSFGYDPLYRWGGYWGGYWDGYWSGYWGWNRPYFHHHHYYSPYYYHHYSPYYYHRPHYAWDRPQYTPNGRQPNRYGGSVVSSGSSSSVNGRRATVGTASTSSVSGRRAASSVTSSSSGSSTINGVRTNRGTVIGNSVNSTSNSNRGYSIGSAGTSRRGTTSSGSVSVPSSSQSRRQTTINRTTPSRNSYNSNSVSTGRRSSSSSYNRGTTSSGRSSSFSSGASSSRRSSGSYSSSSSSSSRRSSGTSSRSTSSGGRGGRR